MTKHPEQATIDILLRGDLAGWDQDSWDEFQDASRALSPAGKLEYERQHAAMVAEVRQQLATLEWLRAVSPMGHA